MKKIILDLKMADSRERLHEYLAFELELPEYYGKNLDALYDELTSIGEDTCIGVFSPKEGQKDMSDYRHRLVRVFQDAEMDNEHLCVIFNELEDNYREE